MYVPDVNRLALPRGLPNRHAMNDIKAAQALETRGKLERVARKLFAARGFAVVDTLMQEVHAKLKGSASGASDPLQAIERGISVFLKVCTEPSVQNVLLVDAPAVLGWPKWREMDAKYGFGLLKSALATAMQAGLIRKQNVDILTHILLGALIETAMVVARSDDPANARGEAQRALLSMLAGWQVSK